METVKIPRQELVNALVERDGTLCQYPGKEHELDFTVEDGPNLVTLCKFEPCDREAKSLGFCKSHYVQHRRGRGMKPLRIVNDPIARFWSKVNKTDTHWLWIPGPRGGAEGGEYGAFSIGTKKLFAHRYSYEINVGPIPDGLEIDHVCRVKLCVKPQHLRAVTRLDNMANRDDPNRGIRGKRPIK